MCLCTTTQGRVLVDCSIPKVTRLLVRVILGGCNLAYACCLLRGIGGLSGWRQLKIGPNLLLGLGFCSRYSIAMSCLEGITLVRVQVSLSFTFVKYYLLCENL